MKETCDGLNGDERKRRSEEGKKGKKKRLSEEDEKNERKKRHRKEGKVEAKSEKSQRKDHHHHSSDNRSSNNGKYDKKTREGGKGLEKHESKHNREEEKKRRNRSRTNNDELGCYQSSNSGLKDNKSDEWITCMDMELGLDRWNPQVKNHAMEWGYEGVKSQGSDFAAADNMKKSTELEEKSATPTLSDVENSTKYDSRVYKKLKIASDLKVGKPSRKQFHGSVPSIQQGWEFPFPSNIQRGGSGRI